jgi:tetratricopeptide (TPR) repeat protein
MTAKFDKITKILFPALRAPILGVCICLLTITWLVFGETLRHPPINLDDPGYVFENPRIVTGLTASGVLWAFRHSQIGNWHPLTSISHMLDCQLFGLTAGGHHFTNVLLHTIAVLLLFLVLRQMTGALWRSAFVAAVFAIHPLRVESVAWIAERKDVLSGVFFMLTLGAYVRYVRNPSGIRYVIVALLFALGLMAKPMLVTLPLVLLLLDYWPLRRMQSRNGKRGSRVGQRSGAPGPKKHGGQKSAVSGQWSVLSALVIEKMPLFALSAASCVATALAQKSAFSSTADLPLLWRINNALVSYVAYIWHMVCPIRLALVYPHPEYRLSFWEAAAALVFLAGVAAVVLVFGKRHRYLITGWFWYVGMLVPVIGIIQVGVQARADRYTYLPQIGLYLMVTWVIADVSVQWRYRRQILSIAAAIVIGALAWLAWIQGTYWRDSETLWTHTLAVTSQNDVAHATLAGLLLTRDRVNEAISHSQEALAIRPRNGGAHSTLAVGLYRTGRVRDAIAHWKTSLETRPDDMDAQANLAWVFATSPDASLRNGTKAIDLSRKVLERGQANAIVLRTLAAAYAETGRFTEAIDTAEQALQLAITQDNFALIQELQLNISYYRKNLPLRDFGAKNTTPPADGNQNWP